jgi:hypothetical protein
MKNKVIAAVVIIAVGMVSEGQAMAGAATRVAQSFVRIKQLATQKLKAFEKKVDGSTFFCVVGGSMLSGIVLSKYLYNEERREFENPLPLAHLAPEVDKEIKSLFKKHGFVLHKIFDSSPGGLAVGYEDSDKEYMRPFLLLGDLHSAVLAHGQLDICQGKTMITLREEHITAALGHEVDHLIHKDGQVSKELFGGKSWLGDILRGLGFISKEEAAFGRQMEERCDRNAPFNVAGREADPEILAVQAENLAHFMEFYVSEEEKMLKEIPSEFVADVVKILDHPLCSDRVVYLKELASMFRLQKAVQEVQQQLKKRREESMTGKVAAFAKQQRELFGKLVRGEVKTHSDFPPLKMTRSFEKHS